MCVYIYIDIDRFNFLGVPSRSMFLSLKANKALGCDGYSAVIFKKAWSILATEVVSAIRSFFRSVSLLRETNTNAISLVPKVPNLSRIGE